jgi:protein gp37
MGQKTTIEWTDASWNPVRGCSRVSEGCRNCYAEKIAARFSGKGEPYEGLAQIKHIRRVNGSTETTESHWTGEVRFIEEHLKDPPRWKKPRRVFVNSMSDLFHEGVPDEWIDKIFAVMALAGRHTFQVLTKRPQRMLEYMQRLSRGIKPIEAEARAMGHTFLYGSENQFSTLAWPIRNVWLGVSVEDQKNADMRVPLLLKTPAHVRWVSYEPALGPVNFGSYLQGHCAEHDFAGGFCTERQHNGVQHLNWIVCGGESGTHARPMHPDWARRARDQCVAAGVPFFFKQWGEWAPRCNFEQSNTPVPRYGAAIADGQTGLCTYRIGKKKAGRLLDGREWNQFPVTRVMHAA